DGDSTNDIPKLFNPDGTATFTTAQEFAERLAVLLGMDPGIIEATYVPLTKQLTFHLNVQVDFAAEAPMDLGFELEEGLADFSVDANASVIAALSFNLVFGIDLNYEPGDDLANYVFIKDPALHASITATAEDIDATARFGFLSVQIVDGFATAEASIDIELVDPDTNPD